MFFVSPANDFFFRFLFGKTGHESLTLDFINAVLADVQMGPLQSLTIQNPFNAKESISDKETILDIKAEDEMHRLYNIEMQLDGNPLFSNRSLYYWARCYTSQLREGEDYRDLSPVICINIIDFRVFKSVPELEKRVHRCFLLTEHHSPNLVLTDHLMIHFLHLTEIQKGRYTDCEPLNQWLQYFCMHEDNMKGLETLLESNPAIQKAHRLHRQFTADELLMEQYEARQKHLRDISTIKGYSYNEGAAERARDIVHNMHQKGLDVPTIAEYTALSVPEVERILNTPSEDD